jgi:hypothetical protein
MLQSMTKEFEMQGFRKVLFVLGIAAAGASQMSASTQVDNLKYSCAMLDGRYMDSSQSCYIKASIVESIVQYKTLPDVYFRDVTVDPAKDLKDVLLELDDDSDISNGVTITLNRFREWRSSLNPESADTEDDQAINTDTQEEVQAPSDVEQDQYKATRALFAGKVFYSELNGRFYKLSFDEDVTAVKATKLKILSRSKAQETAKTVSLVASIDSEDTITMASGHYTVVAKKNGKIKLINQKTKSSIRIFPQVKWAIAVYKRRMRRHKKTPFEMTQHHTDTVVTVTPTVPEAPVVEETPAVEVETTPPPAPVQDVTEVEEKPEEVAQPQTETTPPPAPVQETPEVEEKPEEAVQPQSNEVTEEAPAVVDAPNQAHDDTTTQNESDVTEDDSSDHTILNEEQSNAVSTETGKIQNYNTRMGRMVQEYKLVLNMVNKTTAETSDSGAWNDPDTWKGGHVPADGARVLIHAQHRVVINRELDTRIRTLKIEGELTFNPHKNTQLYVDTIVTLPGSVLRIGEPGTPIDADKTAKIVISDYNEEGMITNDPKSPDYDPLRIGQGILTNGLFLAHGADKTPYVALDDDGAKQGDTVVHLEEAPEGWQVGDTIVVNGIASNGTESELRHIVAIDDTKITIDDPLSYNHHLPKTTLTDVDMEIHVANLSRNIIIKTDPDVLSGKGDKNNPENVEHRGHVLFMHNNNVNINGIEFLDLGRTNKKYRLNETKFTSEAVNARATYIGTNQAARYPVHFHRAGLDGKIGRVKTCVVFNSPGWGYVNHSSNVLMKNNIAYGVYGASFITEAGDENGVFEANMAIATRGLGNSDVRDWKSRENDDDWGFQGNGFWVLGKNVDIVDNIIVGSSNSAFAIAHKTIDDVTGVVDSDTQEESKISIVGLKSFVGNVAYGNSGGVFGILSGTKQTSKELISGLLAYGNAGMNNGELISWWYPDNIVLENITIIGDIDDPKYTGIGTQTKLRQITIKDVKIEGLNVGLKVPSYVGPNVIENAYLNNLVNMYFASGTTNRGANTRIQGIMTYGVLPNHPKQVKMKFGLEVIDKNIKNYWTRQYLASNIIYAPDGETPMKLYHTLEQSPSFVIKIGKQKGKTNAQLIREGHKPVGGELVPTNAIKMPDMENVSGVAVE